MHIVEHFIAHNIFILSVIAHQTSDWCCYDFLVFVYSLIVHKVLHFQVEASHAIQEQYNYHH